MNSLYTQTPIEHAYASYLLVRYFKQDAKAIISSVINDDGNSRSIDIGGAVAVPFLLKSGLEREILKAIWNLIDAKGEGTLSYRAQFQVMLRFVSLGQAGILSPDNSDPRTLLNSLNENKEKELPLPHFSGIEIPSSVDLLFQYSHVGKGANLVKNSQVRSCLTQKSQQQDKTISVSDAFRDLAISVGTETDLSTKDKVLSEKNGSTSQEYKNHGENPELISSAFGSLVENTLSSIESTALKRSNFKVNKDTFSSINVASLATDANTMSSNVEDDNDSFGEFEESKTVKHKNNGFVDVGITCNVPISDAFGDLIEKSFPKTSSLSSECNVVKSGCQETNFVGNTSHAKRTETVFLNESKLDTNNNNISDKENNKDTNIEFRDIAEDDDAFGEFTQSSVIVEEEKKIDEPNNKNISSKAISSNRDETKKWIDTPLKINNLHKVEGDFTQYRACGTLSVREKMSAQHYSTLNVVGDVFSAGEINLNKGDPMMLNCENNSDPNVAMVNDNNETDDESFRNFEDANTINDATTEDFCDFKDSKKKKELTKEVFGVFDTAPFSSKDPSKQRPTSKAFGESIEEATIPMKNLDSARDMKTNYGISLGPEMTNNPSSDGKMCGKAYDSGFDISGDGNSLVSTDDKKESNAVGFFAERKKTASPFSGTLPPMSEEDFGDFKDGKDIKQSGNDNSGDEAPKVSSKLMSISDAFDDLVEPCVTVIESHTSGIDRNETDNFGNFGDTHEIIQSPANQCDHSNPVPEENLNITVSEVFGEFVEPSDPNKVKQRTAHMSLHYDCLENIDETGNSMCDSDFGEFEDGTKTNVFAGEPDSDVFGSFNVDKSKVLLPNSLPLDQKGGSFSNDEGKTLSLVAGNQGGKCDRNNDCNFGAFEESVQEAEQSSFGAFEENNVSQDNLPGESEDFKDGNNMTISTPTILSSDPKNTNTSMSSSKTDSIQNPENDVTFAFDSASTTIQDSSKIMSISDSFGGLVKSDTEQNSEVGVVKLGNELLNVANGIIAPHENTIEDSTCESDFCEFQDAPVGLRERDDSKDDDGKRTLSSNKLTRTQDERVDCVELKDSTTSFPPRTNQCMQVVEDNFEVCQKTAESTKVSSNYLSASDAFDDVVKSSALSNECTLSDVQHNGITCKGIINMHSKEPVNLHVEEFGVFTDGNETAVEIEGFGNFKDINTITTLNSTEISVENAKVIPAKGDLLDEIGLKNDLTFAPPDPTSTTETFNMEDTIHVQLQGNLVTEDSGNKVIRELGQPMSISDAFSNLVESHVDGDNIDISLNDGTFNIANNGESSDINIVDHDNEKDACYFCAFVGEGNTEEKSNSLRSVENDLGDFRSFEGDNTIDASNILPDTQEQTEEFGDFKDIKKGEPVKQPEKVVKDGFDIKSCTSKNSSTPPSTPRIVGKCEKEADPKNKSNELTANKECEEILNKKNAQIKNGAENLAFDRFGVHDVDKADSTTSVPSKVDQIENVTFVNKKGTDASVQPTTIQREKAPNSSSEIRRPLFNSVKNRNDKLSIFDDMVEAELSNSRLTASCSYFGELSLSSDQITNNDKKEGPQEILNFGEFVTSEEATTHDFIKDSTLSTFNNESVSVDGANVNSNKRTRMLPDAAGSKGIRDNESLNSDSISIPKSVEDSCFGIFETVNKDMNATKNVPDLSQNGGVKADFGNFEAFKEVVRVENVQNSNPSRDVFDDSQFRNIAALNGILRKEAPDGFTMSFGATQNVVENHDFEDFAAFNEAPVSKDASAGSSMALYTTQGVTDGPECGANATLNENTAVKETQSNNGAPSTFGATQDITENTDFGDFVALTEEEFCKKATNGSSFATSTTPNTTDRPDTGDFAVLNEKSPSKELCRDSSPIVGGTQGKSDDSDIGHFAAFKEESVTGDAPTNNLLVLGATQEAVNNSDFGDFAAFNEDSVKKVPGDPSSTVGATQYGTEKPDFGDFAAFEEPVCRNTLADNLSAVGATQDVMGSPRKELPGDPSSFLGTERNMPDNHDFGEFAAFNEKTECKVDSDHPPSSLNGTQDVRDNPFFGNFAACNEIPDGEEASTSHTPSFGVAKDIASNEAPVSKDASVDPSTALGATQNVTEYPDFVDVTALNEKTAVKEISDVNANFGEFGAFAEAEVSRKAPNGVTSATSATPDTTNKPEIRVFNEKQTSEASSKKCATEDVCDNPDFRDFTTLNEEPASEEETSGNPLVLGASEEFADSPDFGDFAAFNEESVSKDTHDGPSSTMGVTQDGNGKPDFGDFAAFHEPVGKDIPKDNSSAVGAIQDATANTDFGDFAAFHREPASEEVLRDPSPTLGATQDVAENINGFAAFKEIPYRKEAANGYPSYLETTQDAPDDTVFGDFTASNEKPDIKEAFNHPSSSLDGTKDVVDDSAFGDFAAFNEESVSTEVVPVDPSASLGTTQNVPHGDPSISYGATGDVEESDFGDFAAFNGESGSKEASTDPSSTFGATPDAADDSQFGDFAVFNDEASDEETPNNPSHEATRNGVDDTDFGDFATFDEEPPIHKTTDSPPLSANGTNDDWSAFHNLQVSATTTTTTSTIDETRSSYSSANTNSFPYGRDRGRTKALASQWSRIVSVVKQEMVVALRLANNLKDDPSFSSNERSTITGSSEFDTYARGLVEYVRIVRLIAATINELGATDVASPTKELVDAVIEVESYWERTSSAMRELGTTLLELDSVTALRERRLKLEQDAARRNEKDSIDVCDVTLQPTSTCDESRDTLSSVRWKGKNVMACVANLWVNKISSKAFQ